MPRPIYERLAFGYYRVRVEDGRYPKGLRILGCVERLGPLWDWETAPTEKRGSRCGGLTRTEATKALFAFLEVEYVAGASGA